MHVITWFAMVAIIIGGIISDNYIAVIGACLGMGCCCITDGIYFIGKQMNRKDEKNNG